MADAPQTFEEAIEALEERVRKLEAGQLPLEESLQLYEQGVNLAQTCHALLDQAEERVAAVIEGAGGPELAHLADPVKNMDPA